MIVLTVRCDSCPASRTADQPEESWNRGLRRVTLPGVGTRDLCGSCLEAERRHLAMSVFGPLLALVDADPFAPAPAAEFE